MIDDDGGQSTLAAVARRHHRFGWWALLVFVTAGLVLESLQGFRAPWYVDADVETRRTMFRLAHAHGALLAVVNLVFAACVTTGLLAGLDRPRRTSTLLLLGSVALPVGFLLGGVWFFDGDPGYAIVLVPVGAIALVAALLDIVRRS